MGVDYGGRGIGGRLRVCRGDRRGDWECSAQSCAATFRRLSWRDGWWNLGRGTGRHCWRWSEIIMGTECWRTCGTMEYGNIFEKDGQVGVAYLGGEPSGDDREYGGGVDGGADVVSQSAIAAKSAGHLFGIRTGMLRRRTVRMTIA